MSNFEAVITKTVASFRNCGRKNVKNLTQVSLDINIPIIDLSSKYETNIGKTKGKLIVAHLLFEKST